MASASTDSPLTRRIIKSFLQFLATVETAPGVDKEGLEVAAQCLTEVFKLNSSGDVDTQSVPSLLELFMREESRTSPIPMKVDDEAMEPNSVSPSVPSPPLPTSAVREIPEKHADMSMDGDECMAGPSKSSHLADLFEQFTDGLELSGYFNVALKGSPEYTKLIDEANTVFQGSVKKFKYSEEQASEQADAEVLAEAFKVQGNTSMKEQHFLEAIQLYTLAISLCPNNAIFYSNRAAAHSEVGKYGEAIADCEKAIQIDPSYSKAYSRLGWVYHAQGRFQEAIDMGFQKALNLDPSNNTAKENLVAAQQKLAEQHQHYHQDQQPGQNPFGQGMNFTGQLPGNIQLPPEMANLIPGIMNLAAQFGTRQGDSNNAQQQGPAGPANHADGHYSEHEDDDVHVDANINISVNGQEMPPQFANLMTSMLQMFGSGGANNNQRQESQNNQGPPGGTS